jgi:hypothetical protein
MNQHHIQTSHYSRNLQTHRFIHAAIFRHAVTNMKDVKDLFIVEDRFIFYEH